MADEAGTAAWRAWALAIRPQTLPAGIAPVLVGIALALRDDVFHGGAAFGALLGALLIQIGTNLANDYYDAIRGVDTADREGFTRVTHAGLLAPAQVKRGMAVTFLAAIALGTYLVYLGGLPIVVVGLVSIAAGIAYAGGPIPYGSYGLGDLFVFVFFGLVAVTGTYYVQAAAVLTQGVPGWLPPNSITSEAVLGGVAIGALTTALLVVNNLRDIRTDADAGKRTLAVILGQRFTRYEFLVLLCVAYAVPGVLALGEFGPVVLLPWLSLPFAGLVLRSVLAVPPGARLNATLERTGQLLLLFAVLFAVGVTLA